MQLRKIDDTHWRYRSHVITETDYSINVEVKGRNGKTWTEPRSVFTVEGEYAHIGVEAGLPTLTQARKAVDTAISDGLKHQEDMI